MKASKIFVRANHDVLRSVIGVRDKAGAFLHTGLRRHSLPGGRRYLVQREPHQRVDHLLSLIQSPAAPAAETLPEWLFGADFGDHGLEAQQSTRLLDSTYDVLVFSLQAEVEHQLWSHRGSGRLIYAGSARWRRQAWTATQQKQFQAEFEEVPPLLPDAWAYHFARLLTHVRRHTRCPIVLFTGEVPRLRPLDFDFRLAGCVQPSHSPGWLRNGAFLRAAIELAGSNDFFIMNSAAILCGVGTDRCVTAPFRYAADVYPLLTAELARILDQVLPANDEIREHGR
jgi:hypothetical protein